MGGPRANVDRERIAATPASRVGFWSGTPIRALRSPAGRRECGACPATLARMEEGSAKGFRPRLAIAQGVFDVLTGAWPLLHMRSFTAVTGPKREHWLV